MLQFVHWGFKAVDFSESVSTWVKEGGHRTLEIIFSEKLFLLSFICNIVWGSLMKEFWKWLYFGKPKSCRVPVSLKACFFMHVRLEAFKEKGELLWRQWEYNWPCVTKDTSKDLLKQWTASRNENAAVPNHWLQTGPPSRPPFKTSSNIYKNPLV